MSKPKKTRAPKTLGEKAAHTAMRRGKNSAHAKRAAKKLYEPKNPTPTRVAQEERLTLEDIKLLKRCLLNSFNTETWLVPVDDLGRYVRDLKAKLGFIIENEKDPNLPPRPAIDVAWMTAADCGFIVYALYHMSHVVKHYTGSDEVWADKLRTRLMLVAKGTQISAIPEKDEVQVTLRRDLCWLLGRCAAYAALGEAFNVQGNRVATDLGSFLKSAAASKYLSSFHFETSVPPVAQASEEFASLGHEKVNATALLDRAKKIIPENDDFDWYSPTSTGFSIGDCYTLAACVEATNMLAITRDPNTLEDLECFNTPDLQRLKANLVMAAVAGSVATPPRIGDVVSVMMPNAPNTEKKNPEDKFSVYNTLRQLHKNFPVQVGNWHKSQPVKITLLAEDWLIASSCIKAVTQMLKYLTPGGRERIQDVFDADNLERIRAELAQSALLLRQRPQGTKPSPITPAPSPQEAQNPSTSPNPEPSTPGTTQTSSNPFPQPRYVRVERSSDPTDVHAGNPTGDEGSHDKPKGEGGTEAEDRAAAKSMFYLLPELAREEIAKKGIAGRFLGHNYVFRDEMAKLIADWKLEQGVKAARARFEQLNSDERDRYRVFDYEAGLRRAQELAKELIRFNRDEDLCCDQGAFNQAIDAEAAKWRT